MDRGLSQYPDENGASVTSLSTRLMNPGHSWVHIRNLLYPTKLRMHSASVRVYSLMIWSVEKEKQKDMMIMQTTNCLNDQFSVKLIVKSYTHY